MKQQSNTRKSSFVRTLEYFRTADIEEAEACLQSATQIIVSRTTPETPRRTRTVRKYNRANGAPIVEDATLTPREEHDRT